jgi:FKBP-type peptidyl-prolyl cis-trans isomerase
MQLKIFFQYSAAFFLGLGCAYGADEVQPKSTSTAVAIKTDGTVDVLKKAEMEAKYCEAIGWLMCTQMQVESLNLDPKQLEAVKRGIDQGTQGKPCPVEPQDQAACQAWWQEKSETYAKSLEAQNKEIGKSNREKGAAFLDALKAKNKDNKNFGTLPSGVCYEILNPGEGNKAATTDEVTLHYTGALIDGTVFDSSLKSGQPVTFPVMGVIPGFAAGLQLLAKGAKAKFYIPADQAYGDKDLKVIPPGSCLVFDVDLLEIQPITSSTNALLPDAVNKPSTSEVKALPASKTPSETKPEPTLSEVKPEAPVAAK